MEGILFPLMMVAMVGFMFYSQRKQQKNRMETLNQIQKGDEIVTIGGLYGIVDELTADKVVLDVDGVYLTFDRSAIRNRVAQTPTVEAPIESPVESTEQAIESAMEE